MRPRQRAPTLPGTWSTASAWDDAMTQSPKYTICLAATLLIATSATAAEITRHQTDSGKIIVNIRGAIDRDDDLNFISGVSGAAKLRRLKEEIRQEEMGVARQKP
jgi:hypothetical protein